MLNRNGERRRERVCGRGGRGICYLIIIPAGNIPSKRPRGSKDANPPKRAKWTDELHAIELEEEEKLKMEEEREKDIKERDDLAERLRKKDKERTRNIIEKVCGVFN